MQTRIINRLVKKHVLPSFSEWNLHRNLLYEPPLDMMLYGYCFSGDTAVPQSCRLWEFGMPLFVPRNRLIFNFGDMLDGKRHSYFPIAGPDGPAVLAELVELIRARMGKCRRRFSSVAAFTENLESLKERETDEIYLETLGFAYVLLKKKQKAKRTLKMLIRVLEYNAIHRGDIELPYQERQARATEMLDLIDSDIDKAIARLKKYRRHTIDAIGLEEL